MAPDICVTAVEFRDISGFSRPVISRLLLRSDICFISGARDEIWWWAQIVSKQRGTECRSCTRDVARCVTNLLCWLLLSAQTHVSCCNTVLQIQPNQFTGDIRDTFFQKFQKIFMWQAMQYQYASKVCNVWGPPMFWVPADIYWAEMLTPEITVILFTRGLPYVIIKFSRSIN